MSTEAINALAELGARFHGTDLSFRRAGTDWPAPWRARLHATKNERAEYRMEAFGETAAIAVFALVQKVEAVDAEGFVRLDTAAKLAAPSVVPEVTKEIELICADGSTTRVKINVNTKYLSIPILLAHQPGFGELRREFKGRLTVEGVEIWE